MRPQLLFSDYFGISPEVLESSGALDICIEADLPLFIDPFLLFASEKPEYKQLHSRIVGHLVRLKEHATSGSGINSSLFQFHEIKQNWLGDSRWGNSGRGLGKKFAQQLIANFQGFYSSFGAEGLTESSHIEKLTLVGSGVGRDFISDFTTNLLLEYLLEFTQEFAVSKLDPSQRRSFTIRCALHEKLMVWLPRTFELPYFYKGDRAPDFLLLTPLDILSKDDAFLCHNDYANRFRGIASTIGNEALRESINIYFQGLLPRAPKKPDVERAIEQTTIKFPELLDYYIRDRELHRSDASNVSAEKVLRLKTDLLQTMRNLAASLGASDFYSVQPTSYEAALKRVGYLKDVIENNDCYRIFFKNGKPIASEETIQRIFRLTWFGTDFDVNAEVNNGRGPADYKISYGERDSCIVEFKLASSSKMKANLKNQVEVYKKASRSISDIKVILCYNSSEVASVHRTLKLLGLEGEEGVVVIDASPKISASRVL